MLQVRGLILLSTLKQARAGLPSDAWAALWERLDAEVRSRLEGPVDPAGWVPAAALARLMEAFAAALPDEPRVTYQRLGRQSCEDTLSAVYRSPRRLTSPEFILRRAVHLWNDYYDRGEFEVLESLPEAGAIRVTEIGFPSPAFCHRITGWIERAVELTGGREVAVGHPVCTFEGAGCDEWRARWRL